MKRFKEALESGEFVVTAECGPPKGTDLHEMIENIKSIKGKVNAINATDNQSAVMRVSSMAICKIILDMGIEPIFQLTCRDRNRLAIQSDLLGADVLGIKNLLSLTGDYVSTGDHKEAKPVFDIESVQLLQVVETLNSGIDMAGNRLTGPTDIFAGATVTPESDPIEPQLLKFEKKIKAGAKFFQTQAIYDIEAFKKFMEYTRGLHVSVLAGILLLKSAGMANYLNRNVPGIRVPDELIAELKEAGKEKASETGIDIAVRTIKGVKDYCSGVHIMAIGAEDKIPEIIDRAGL